MVSGTLDRFVVATPVSDDGQVTVVVGGHSYDLLTRHADTDVCCDGATTRGSDVVKWLAEALFDGAGKVDVMLWPPDLPGPVLTAKFNT